MNTKKTNIKNLVRPNIKQMKPYASARDEYKSSVSNMVFLDANENPFENGVNRYPDPQQIRLKSILATQRNVFIDNILIGNGSDEVLDLIFRAFCEPNQDNIITLPPTYGMYEVLANINAVDVLEVSLSSVFQPLVKNVLDKQNNNSKLLFVCSPNNPTANSFDKDRIETLINNFNGIVVIDEAYIDFSEEESWLYRLNEFPNLIVTQTLSKAYGMAGIRLGICYASAEIISVLNKIKPPYNVNTLTQQKAIKQLSDSKIVETQVELLKTQRKLLRIELENIDFIETIYPSDANFLLIKVDDASKRYNQLLEKGIVIRNRTTQHLCENCIRITVGTPQENQELINILKILT
jgi:histidinol-phosphate aminotransferase